MECDYEEGECSICGKRVQSKNDYCIHLRKYKGGAFQGKPVFEILHGVTFTGLGLLDRKGADENARITQVASEGGEVSETLNEGGPTMDEKQKAKDEAALAAKKAEEGGGNAADDKARIKELEKENKVGDWDKARAKLAGNPGDRLALALRQATVKNAILLVREIKRGSAARLPAANRS